MKPFVKYIALYCFTLTALSSAAQINPPEAQYFHNTYLANPAMAGYSDGLRLNLGYRNQWSDVPGAPVNQNLTLDYRKNKSGLGLSMLNEKKAGLNQTEVMGTYVHHVKLNKGVGELHFGLSLGIQKGSYNIQDLTGNQNDPNARAYNDRKTAFDGSFGMAYSSKKLILEFAYYNMKSQAATDVKSSADYNRSYLSANYAFALNNATLKTKLSYRGIRNYKDMVDLGAELKTQDEKLTFSSMYHSNKSLSVGMGYEHNKQWQLIGFYNTAASDISQYAIGSFELGMRFNLRSTSEK